jgi:nitrogen regulatory protein P-II 1
MTRITCIIRPHRLEQVKSAIAALGISGMTVTDVRGRGNSPEKSMWLGSDEHVVALPIRSRVEVVADDALVDALVEAVIENARTGEPGDGKVFLEKIVDAIRIRTGERGDAAI